MQLILISSLIGLKVTSQLGKKKLGKVQSVLFDTDNGEVVGFIVKFNLLSPAHFLDLEDIEALDKQGILVKKEDVIEPLNKSQKAQEIYKQGFKLVGISVKTETGKKVGRVTDIAISLTHSMLTSIYVGGFLQDRIISRDNIISISKKAIVINDTSPLADSLPNLTPIA